MTSVSDDAPAERPNLGLEEIRKELARTNENVGALATSFGGWERAARLIGGA